MNDKLAELLIAHGGKTGVTLVVALCLWLINSAYQDLRTDLALEIERNQNQAERIVAMETQLNILMQRKP